ncbi:hypothetical protein AX15_002208 [Amanita polypyramis BW_CC]|nr:hypothetical protein AX15_002208 [Amanita polypyramis BW_CC]
MVLLTPGVRLLASGVAYCSIPVIWATAIQCVMGRIYNIHVPTWAVALGSVAALPLAMYMRVFWKRWKDQRDADAMGAQVVPKAKGKKFGNLDIVQRMREVWEFGYPGDYLGGLFDSFGPLFNLYIMHADLYFTSSPEHIKLMLATEFPNFIKGERFRHVMDSVLGTGVFNSDGDMWKFHRSITRPAFNRDRISDYELFDRHAKIAISQLRQRLREGFAVDFQDCMFRFTLDTATEFLFGNCVHSLSAGLPYPHNVILPLTSFENPSERSRHTVSANAFATAFLEAQRAVACRERYGWIWPLLETLEDKARKPMKIVDEYIEPIVREALTKKRVGAFTEKTAGEAGERLREGEALLDHLVRVTEDPKVLKDETLNILIAGRDTTASTLSFTIYLLAIHPHVTVRLRQEILDKVGSTRMPDPNDIKDMKYLRAVINETLRLFPVVPFNVRDSIKATTWPNPDPTQKSFYIPARTKCAYSVFMMHRRKDLWGPDALQFDPDRFLDDRLKKYLVGNPFIFLPFNAGPRICLGQQFAYNEMSFMLIRLLQSFSSVDLDPASAPPDSLPPPEWKEARGRKAIEKIMLKYHLTMYSHGGLWVKMKEATDVFN